MKNITEEIRYNAPIVRIKVTRDRVIVALQNALHLYHGFANHFVPIRRIDLTAKISGSVVDLSIHPVNKCIAYPNTNRVGHLIVADCIETDKTKYIPAHDSKLAAVAIDPNGRTVASASESGALIKVHRTFNGELVYEFKRGVTLYAKMLSLGFSNNARYLWTHESTGFLKFYKIGFRASVAANGASWFLEKFQRIAQSILPGNASNWLFQEDNFAYGEQVLGSSPEAAGHIFKNDANQIPPHLILVSIDGYVYSYEINTVEGGSCEIICCYDIERKTICETPQILNWDELR